MRDFRRRPDGPAPPLITAENLATGEFPELARFSVGKRALLFVRRPAGWGLAIVTAALDEHGYVTRVHGSFYVNDSQLDDLQRSLAEACAQIEGAKW